MQASARRICGSSSTTRMRFTTTLPAGCDRQGSNDHGQSLRPACRRVPSGRASPARSPGRSTCPDRHRRQIDRHRAAEMGRSPCRGGPAGCRVRDRSMHTWISVPTAPTVRRTAAPPAVAQRVDDHVVETSLEQALRSPYAGGRPSGTSTSTRSRGLSRCWLRAAAIGSATSTA